MKPKLKLTIDISADIKNAQNFVARGEFVDWFLPNELQYITKKKFSAPTRNRIITQYTMDFYTKNEKEILKGVSETKKRWKKTESAFYKIVNNIFCGHPWPKGKYIGFSSIFLIYPKNVKKKIFFFPYASAKWDSIGTIAHEMLHFIFFDFIKKHYGIKEDTELKGKNPRYVWQVSETFNAVIENWKPYRSALKINDHVEPYPGCEKMYVKMKKQWEEKEDAALLLSRWFSSGRFW